MHPAILIALLMLIAAPADAHCGGAHQPKPQPERKDKPQPKQKAAVGLRFSRKEDHAQHR